MAEGEHGRAARATNAAHASLIPLRLHQIPHWRGRMPYPATRLSLRLRQSGDALSGNRSSRARRYITIHAGGLREDRALPRQNPRRRVCSVHQLQNDDRCRQSAERAIWIVEMGLPLLVQGQQTGRGRFYLIGFARRLMPCCLAHPASGRASTCRAMHCGMSLS